MSADGYEWVSRKGAKAGFPRATNLRSVPTNLVILSAAKNLVTARLRWSTEILRFAQDDNNSFEKNSIRDYSRYPRSSF